MGSRTFYYCDKCGGIKDQKTMETNRYFGDRYDVGDEFTLFALDYRVLYKTSVKYVIVSLDNDEDVKIVGKRMIESNT